jgi:hypothetical protein
VCEVFVCLFVVWRVLGNGFLVANLRVKCLFVWRVLGNGFFFTCKNDGGKRWGPSF